MAEGVGTVRGEAKPKGDRRHGSLLQALIPSQSSGLRLSLEVDASVSGGGWQPQVAGGSLSIQPSIQSSTQSSIQPSVFLSALRPLPSIQSSIQPSIQSSIQPSILPSIPSSP